MLYSPLLKKPAGTKKRTDGLYDRLRVSSDAEFPS